MQFGPGDTKMHRRQRDPGGERPETGVSGMPGSGEIRHHVHTRHRTVGQQRSRQCGLPQGPAAPHIRDDGFPAG